MEIISSRPRSLIRQEKIQTEGLTISEQAIIAISVQSASNPRIRDHQDLLAIAEIINNTVNIRMELKPKKYQELEVLLQSLEADLMKFPNLTESEILKALNLGIDGTYNPTGDFFFSSSQFVKWIRAYVESTKKPVIAKHAQLLHQVKDPETVLSREEHIKIAAECANMYSATRRGNPDFRVIAAAPLYENIEQLGIYALDIAEKWEIASKVVKLHPNANDDEIKILSKSVAYNRFIENLTDLNQMVSTTGQIIDLIGHYQTIDDCEYQVYTDTILDGKKRVISLMAKCTKSKTKSDHPFPILETNIARMINFGSWVKIE
jgi:hypothetical protein